MPAAEILSRAHDHGVGDDDPAAKPRRRRFSAEYAEYKLCILAEYEALTDPVAEGRCCAGTASDTSDEP